MVYDANIFTLVTNKNGCYGCVAIYSINDNLKHIPDTLFTSPKQPDHKQLW